MEHPGHCVVACLIGCSLLCRRRACRRVVCAPCEFCCVLPGSPTGTKQFFAVAWFFWWLSTAFACIMVAALHEAHSLFGMLLLMAPLVLWIAVGISLPFPAKWYAFLAGVTGTMPLIFGATSIRTGLLGWRVVLWYWAGAVSLFTGLVGSLVAMRWDEEEAEGSFF